MYQRRYPAIKRISARHKRLVDHYFDCNFVKAEACRRAGYKSPDKYATKLFKHPDVVAEIERRRKRLSEKFDLSRDWIVSRLMRLVESNLNLKKFMKVDDEGNLYWDFTDATDEEKLAINNLQVDTYVEAKGNGKVVTKMKVGAADPLGALQTLARIQGLFQDNVNVSGEVSVIDRLQAGRNRLAKKDDE